MAEYTGDITLDISGQSESLLPQRQAFGQGHNSQSLSTSSESSLEMSGFSRVVSAGDDYDTEMDDPFNNVFYRVIPSQNSTHIHFYAYPLFNMIVSVLDKEFSTPGDDVTKFRLSTHVDGKKCFINVDRTDRTIVATGAGHIQWKLRNFRKMALKMFKTFVDKTSLAVENKSDNMSVTASQVNSTSPVMHNIFALMDMINTLQGQVAKLTEEVNKLVIQQATSSLTHSAEETTVSHTEDSTKHEDVLNHANGEMSHISNVSSLRNSNQDRNSIRLTSTPGPRINRLEDTFVIPNSPAVHPPPPTRPEPVPKVQTTVPNRSVKKILLIGDSIITHMNKQGLKNNVYKHGLSGGTIQTLLNEMEVYDLRQFSHVVIYIGGNNASNKNNIRQFENMYSQLLSSVKVKESQCKIILVNSCPRGDTDVGAINDAIQRLSDSHETMLIDAYNAFYDKKGKLISKYFSADSIHLSDSGIRRLLGTINGKIDIVHDFAHCTFNAVPRRHAVPKRQYKQTPARQIGRANLIYPNQDGHLPCAKCGESNHLTWECKHKEQLQCHQCGYYGHKSRRCGKQ